MNTFGNECKQNEYIPSVQTGSQTKSSGWMSDSSYHNESTYSNSSLKLLVDEQNILLNTFDDECEENITKSSFLAENLKTNKTLIEQANSSNFGFCFMGLESVADFSGNLDEDLISYLRKFEDNYRLHRDSRLKAATQDQIKADHLIAKLKDPARTRVETLSVAEQKSYKAIVKFLTDT